MRILICDDDLSITQSLSQIIKTYFNKKKGHADIFLDRYAYTPSII